MEYLLMIHSHTNTDAEAVPEEARRQMLGAYRAYTEAIQQSGALKSSNRLRPAASATTVRVRDGKTEVLDGPFADTKEQLGGYYLIEVPNLDAALSWAARCPGAAHGTVEVRPVWPMGEY